MKMKTLGRTGLQVTENSFGALPIQRISEQEAADLLRYASDSGVNFFDTSDSTQTASTRSVSHSPACATR